MRLNDNSSFENASHQHTRSLLEAWSQLEHHGGKWSDALPQVASSDMSEAVSGIFMLKNLGGADFPILHCGDALDQAWRRDLTGRNFLKLFKGKDQWLARIAVENAFEFSSPSLFKASLSSLDGLSVPVEFALAPLKGRGSARLLGLFQPLASLSRLRGRPVASLRIEALFPAGPIIEEPVIRLAASNS